MNNELIRGITIDVNPHSKMIDDGLALEITEGIPRLKICLAYPKDVGKGSDLDILAFENAIANQACQQVKPLFASEVLERYSLTLGQRQSVLCFDYKIASDYSIASEAQVYEAIFVNSFQTSYHEAAKMLCQPKHSRYEQLQSMLAIAKKSWQIRINANSEYGWKECWPTRSEEEMQIMVAELMNLANRTAGKFLSDQDAVAVYRNCILRDGRAEFTLDDLRDLKTPLEIRESVCSLGIRSKGHALLGFPAYVTLTSPLWRYVDLVNQRIFCRYLLKQGAAYRQKDLWAVIEALSIVSEKTNHSAKTIVQAEERLSHLVRTLISVST